MLEDRDAWRRRKQSVCVGKNRNLAFVDTGGEGPAALLLHGYTDTSRSYQGLAAHLGGFRLIMPDLPGHGDSDEHPGLDLSALACDMHALADVLGIVPSLVIGHSFGSVLALELARARGWPHMKVVMLAGSAWPALAGLEALEPIRSFDPALDPLHPFLDRWYAGPVALDRHFLADVRAEAVGMPVRVWHRYLELLENADFRTDLPGLQGSFLLISGGRDELFDARHADLLSHFLPDAQDLRLPHKGHNPHWEAPEEVALLIRTWVDATGPKVA